MFAALVMRLAPIPVLLACVPMALVLIMFTWHLPELIGKGYIVHPKYSYFSCISKILLLVSIALLSKKSLYLFLLIHVVELSLLVVASEWFNGSSLTMQKFLYSSVLPTSLMVVCFFYKNKFEYEKDH